MPFPGSYQGIDSAGGPGPRYDPSALTDEKVEQYLKIASRGRAGQFESDEIRKGRDQQVRNVTTDIYENPDQFAKGMMSAPFTIAPDLIGPATNALVPERWRPNFLSDMSGDPIREFIGLDPDSLAGRAGEFADPFLWAGGVAAKTMRGAHQAGEATARYVAKRGAANSATKPGKELVPVEMFDPGNPEALARYADIPEGTLGVGDTGPVGAKVANQVIAESPMTRPPVPKRSPIENDLVTPEETIPTPSQAREQRLNEIEVDVERRQKVIDSQRGSVKVMDDDTRGGNALGRAGGRAQEDPTVDTDFVAFQDDAPYSERFPTKKAFDDWKKSTPDSDPEKRDIMYEVLDEERQKIKSGATERDGRPYGAPKGGTDESRAALVVEYAARMERGLDAGINPGYFYEEGRGAIQDVAPGAATQNELGKQIEITSTQIGPAGNVDHTIRGRDQRAVGAQTNAGMYPNAMRPDFDQVSEGVDVFTGYKRDRYGNLLTPEDARRGQMHESALMPPNDRWEFQAGGFKGVPSDPKNVAYMDHFREDAVEIVNAKRRANNGQELTLEQAQEVHWAVIRAESEGRPLQINPGSDTIGGALDRNAYSHTYEATPGSNANHYQSATDEYDNALLDVRNEGGRDPLVNSLGGTLQQEVKPHTGYYIDDKGAGNYAPGQTATSYVSRTDEGGINAASNARVNTTDAIGALAYAQDAYAGNVFTPAGVGKNPKFNGVTIMTKASKEEMVSAVELAQEINPDMVVVNTKDGGLRAWFPGDYSAAAKKQIREFADSVEVSGEAVLGKVESNFKELDWSGGNATQDVLDIIDNVDVSEVNALNQMAGNSNVGGNIFDVNTPGMASRANSPETRAILGKIADKYEELRNAGFGVPNEKLIAVLRTWADEGLPAVRDMVRKGLAPAGVLAILAGQQQESPQNALRSSPGGT